jgi:DNA-binding XRE family transcriptional regulator
VTSNEARCKLYRTRRLHAGDQPLRVPIDDTIRNRVAALRETMTLTAAAKAIGVGRETLSRIERGDIQALNPATAARLMSAATPTPTDVPETVWVSSEPALRRLTALQAIGWSIPKISARIGYDVQNIWELCLGRKPYVTARTHLAVLDAYASMSLIEPPMVTQFDRGAATKAKRRAEQFGWFPPAAWDEAEIDDPAGRPHPEWIRGASVAGRSAEDVAEDVEDILQFNQLATSAEIAERLGYADPSGVQNALVRAHRDDLRAVLNRNAVLAGLNVTRRTA